MALALVLIATMPALKAEQNWKELTTRPDDTLEAERVRIWYPYERSGPCLIQVNLFDKRANLIRHLAERRLAKGYYNLYWDKRDDSGRYVPEGDYRYEVRACGRRDRSGMITAVFARGELAGRILESSVVKAEQVRFELDEDSLRISVTINNFRGKVLDTPFSDSLMNAGTHEFVWKPESKFEVGRYVVKLAIEGYSRSAIIWYGR